MVKKIIVLLVFLPFATTGITDSFEDTPNPQDDKTESHINAIFELLQLFDKETMKNNFDKWISQNPRSYTPSIIINSKNITFTEFPADEDIVPISNLYQIGGIVNSVLSFYFRDKDERRRIPFDGFVEFSQTGNYSSSCQIEFHFSIPYNLNVIYFFNIHNHFSKSVEISEVRKLNTANIKITKLDEKSCKNIDEEQRHNMSMSVQNDILQATVIALIERVNFIRKSVFQSISNTWIHPDNSSYSLRENEYSRFNSHINIGLFPWLSDHNEFVINGLQNFYTLTITWYGNTVSYLVGFNDIKMYWNIGSVTMMQLSFDIGYFEMRGSLNKMVSEEDLSIYLYSVVEVSNGDYVKERNVKFQEMLQVVIANGMEQTIQKIRYDDTKKFISAVREILRPFDENPFEKSLVDLEKLEKNSAFSTISLFKLDIEAFHLKNITWLDSDWREIGGTLKYEKIHGRAEILLQISNNKVKNVPVSVYLFIKEVTIGISTKYSNSSNIPSDAADVKIKPNWNDTDVTIMITSSLYRLSREERIEIGKQIFQYFTNIIENQIIIVTKSTFRSIFDICKNSFSNLTASPLNNQRSFFASIHDYWRDTTNFSITEAVEITIQGSWNFNPINVHYVNRKLSIGGLQLENVKANIKHLKNLNYPIVEKYTASHFSLTINHKKNDVSVNAPSPNQNASDTTEKLKLTFANFMGYLIYDDLEKKSNYHANFRKYILETTKEAIIEDTSSAYNASLHFAANFAHILENREHSVRVSGQYGDTNPLSSYNDQPTSLTLKIMNPKIVEEILICFKNSLSTNNIVEKFAINGTIKVTGYATAMWPFSVSFNRVMNVILDNKDNNTNIIYTDGKNIKNIFRPVRNNVWVDVNLSNNETVKTGLTSLASSFLRDRLKEIPIIRDTHKLNYSLFLPQEKYFFSITNKLDYPYQVFSTYCIKLYGLHNNFKIISSPVYFDNVNRFELNNKYEKLFSISSVVTEFELMITNLTARIIWNHYVGDYISRMPKIMNFEILEITLYAKISKAKRLIFTKQSRLLLLGRDNFPIVKKLEEKLAPIIIKKIQQAILQEYSKIKRNSLEYIGN